MTTFKYRVSWDIDIELEEDSVVEAAREALRLVQKPNTTANVFNVENVATGIVSCVDLTEQTVEMIHRHPLADMAREILQWKKTGLLVGDALRAHAAELKARLGDAFSMGEALSHAEEDVKRQGLELLVRTGRA